MVYGISTTKVIDTVSGIAIRKGTVGNVVEFYGSSSSSCYYKGGPAPVYGFVFTDGEGSEIGYWFKKKADAIFAARWIRETNRDGKGDLEMHLQSANPDLGKCHF